jgi:uncharacterized protein YndB with AHSA1/START domain
MSVVEDLRPDRVLTITRVFDAPRARVWEIWTDPNHARRWWGPRDRPAEHMDMDVRVGGRWRHGLRSPADGTLLWHHGVFREVVVPERLVFSFVWEQEGERGLETLVTVTFTERDAKTAMVFRHEPFQSDAQMFGHQYGWSSSFDRLADYIRNREGDAS